MRLPPPWKRGSRRGWAPGSSAGAARHRRPEEGGAGGETRREEEEAWAARAAGSCGHLVLLLLLLGELSEPRVHLFFTPHHVERAEAGGRAVTPRRRRLPPEAAVAAGRAGAVLSLGLGGLLAAGEAGVLLSLAAAERFGPRFLHLDEALAEGGGVLREGGRGAGWVRGRGRGGGGERAGERAVGEREGAGGGIAPAAPRGRAPRRAAAASPGARRRG